MSYDSCDELRLKRFDETSILVDASVKVLHDIGHVGHSCVLSRMLIHSVCLRTKN